MAPTEGRAPLAAPSSDSPLRPDQVGALLAAVCGSNDVLRGQIEGLILKSSFTGPLHVPSDGATSALDLRSPQPGEQSFERLMEEEAPGSVIGRYTLFSKLGEGGMGTVYLAEQREPVVRQVALKIIKPGMDSREVLARFAAERQALALMDHPNIAKMHDGGLTPQGRPYFVMELVRGVPLARHADAHRLTLRDRLALFLDVCKAVQHAHQKGVIHRDLKPSNILVAASQERAPKEKAPEAADPAGGEAGVGLGSPKVIDFGVAKALERPLTDETLETEAGRILGTFEYMSPEQANLAEPDVDTRSDVYSLGVILYELLTGSRPFTRKERAGADLAELLRIVRETDPPRPSQRLAAAPDLPELAKKRQTEPAKLKRAVAGDLDWIVMKALEKNRERRYATVQGLANDLERHLKDEPVSAGPPSARYRAGKFIRRNRGAAAAAALLALALAAGAAGTTWGWLRSVEKERETGRARDAEARERKNVEAQRDRAMKAEKEAAAQAEIATAVNRFMLNDLLEQADPDQNARHRQVTVETVVDRAARRVAGAFASNPTLEAALRLSIGEVYRSLGNLKESRIHLERAAELRAKLLPPTHPDRLRTEVALASLLYGEGKRQEAEAAYAEALVGLKAALGPDHDLTVEVIDNLGVTLMERGRHDEAEKRFREAHEARLRAHGPKSKEAMKSLNQLGLLRWGQNRHAEAAKLLEQAKAIADESVGYDHPNALEVLNNLGLAYRFLKRFEEAERLYRQALEGRRRVLGEDHQETLATWNNLGMLFMAQKRWADAEAELTPRLAACRKHLGEEHPDTLLAANNLATLFSEQGDTARAAAILEPILEPALRTFGPDHPRRMIFLRNYEANAFAAKDYAKSLPAAQEIVRLEKAKPKPDPNTLASAGGRLALALFRLKRHAEAIPALQEAISLREASAPATVGTQDFRIALAEALVAQNRPAEAESPLRTALGHLRNEKPPTQKGRTAQARSLDGLALVADKLGKADEAERWRQERAVLLKHGGAERP